MRTGIRSTLQSILTSLTDSPPGQWFAAQSSRDQRMLTGLALFLGATMLYLMVWMPVAQQRINAERRYARDQSQIWLVGISRIRCRVSGNNGTSRASPQ